MNVSKYLSGDSSQDTGKWRSQFVQFDAQLRNILKLFTLVSIDTRRNSHLGPVLDWRQTSAEADGSAPGRFCASSFVSIVRPRMVIIGKAWEVDWILTGGIRALYVGIPVLIIRSSARGRGPACTPATKTCRRGPGSGTVWPVEAMEPIFAKVILALCQCRILLTRRCRNRL